MWSFIAKCQLPHFFVCFISGSRVFVAFFVELGGGDDRRVDDRSDAKRLSVLRQHVLHRLEDRLAETMLLSEASQSAVWNARSTSRIGCVCTALAGAIS